MEDKFDLILRQIAVTTQRVEDLGTSISANQDNAQEIRHIIAELRGDLAVMLSTSQENKKKLHGRFLHYVN